MSVRDVRTKVDAQTEGEHWSEFRVQGSGLGLGLELGARLGLGQGLGLGDRLRVGLGLGLVDLTEWYEGNEVERGGGEPHPPG